MFFTRTAIWLGGLSALATLQLMGCGKSPSDKNSSSETHVETAQYKSAASKRLSTNPWCTLIINQKTSERVLERLQFKLDGSLTVTRFKLNSGGQRGSRIGGDAGRWRLNGSTLSGAMNRAQAAGDDGRFEFAMQVLEPSASSKVKVKVSQLRLEGRDSSTGISYEACD